jgi:uncharacterized protein (DUF885 family)
MLPPNSYAEGWTLYAEKLCDELLLFRSVAPLLPHGSHYAAG